MNRQEAIRNLILALGADVCGFANISRFRDAPIGFNPMDIYLGIALPRGLSKVSPRLIYKHYNSFYIPEVDRIAFTASKHIEHDFQCLAIAMPSDDPYEYWDEEKIEG